ncbi:MAG: hypothetical protein KGZ66_10085 [Selenomonadales bacterium]|nr:hypothetical protein [Selenomonadales bacterium]
MKILINPVISPDQLWDFYARNNICEAGYGKETAGKVLEHSSVVVAAFAGEQLVGIARAMFDGLSADIGEFCLENTLQGEGLVYQNGSLMEKDLQGVGKAMGEVLLAELMRMGATFISCYLVGNCEERFYESLGFRENTGHKVYVIDKRPYIT